MMRTLKRFIIASLLVGILAGSTLVSPVGAMAESTTTEVAAGEQTLLTEIPEEEVPMAESPFSKGPVMMWFVVFLFSATILVSVGASGVTQMIFLKERKRNRE
jgi:hypothetical protein